jgi:hypothetical protein
VRADDEVASTLSGKQLDAALAGIPARHSSSVLAVLQSLAWRANFATVSGPDLDLDLDVNASPGVVLPCGLRPNQRRHGASFQRVGRRWIATNPLARFLLTGRCDELGSLRP